MLPSAGTMEKLRAWFSAYTWRITAMLSDIGLPTLSSLLVKCQLSFREQAGPLGQYSANTVVRHFANMFGHVVLVTVVMLSEVYVCISSLHFVITN